MFTRRSTTTLAGGLADGSEIQVVVRALSRLLAEEGCHGEWRRTGLQRRQPRRPEWRSEPRRLNGPPPRSPPRRMPARGPWLPYRNGNPRPRRDWQRQYPEQCSRHWRGSMWPRRGHPVAEIRAPRWCQEEQEERRPSENVLGGPLRGGPERPACDL